MLRAVFMRRKGKDMTVKEAILARRSVRKYNGKPIPEDVLKEIVLAGQIYPSSKSKFPVQLIVVQDPETIQKLAACKNAGAGMLKGAAAAIAVIGDAAAADGWVEDCSIVMTQMMLRATELGVGNCWTQMRMRFQKEAEGDAPAVTADEAVRAILNYPEQYQLEAVLSLGMIDQQPEPHTEDYAKAEMVHFEKF